MKETPPPADWSALLLNAVAKPGVIADAYSKFWNFSFRNQLLAHFQCMLRGIEPGPIHTFVGWKELGRHVKKGEKALTLCMPLTLKRRGKDATGPDELVKENDGTYTVFVYRPYWFTLSQTDGATYLPVALPEWDEERALAELKITRERFRHPDGNTQGYAHDREVAVSPVAFAPARTLFHELAHVILDHTTAGDETSKALREVEAECVALICSESLGLDLAPYSRGYIQHWLAGASIPERSAQRIFKAADLILKAGHPDSNGQAR